MTFLKFLELMLFCVIFSEFCNSRAPAREGKVWEHQQQGLSERSQKALRPILLIKRNRKLRGSVLPREFQCVGQTLWCRAALGLAMGQDCFDFPTLAPRAQLWAWGCVLPSAGSCGSEGMCPVGLYPTGLCSTGLCPTKVICPTEVCPIGLSPTGLLCPIGLSPAGLCPKKVICPTKVCPIG